MSLEKDNTWMHLLVGHHTTIRGNNRLYKLRGGWESWGLYGETVEFWICASIMSSLFNIISTKVKLCM